MSWRRNQILLGDATLQLRTLPHGVVDSVVTSIPYFRLRDYQVTGQLGLEAHVDQWVDGASEVMREVARVLVPTGTLWLNVGDSFSTHDREGAPRKSLLGAPERLMLALIADGWIVRNRVVWAKTNTIPTSVTDRLATKHEVVLLLTRQPKYYFDLDSIRTPHTSRPPKPRRPRARPQRPDWLGPNSDGDTGLDALHAAGLRGHPLGGNPGDVWQLPVSGYRGAHFATFPVSLAHRMVLAGTPEARCRDCRMPYRRPVERLGATATRLALKAMCDCTAGSEPGLVLDPFMGSGTTAIAAEQLERDWLGIELNPDFVTLANGRIDDERRKHQRNRKEVA